jgi:Uncharacterized proteins of the AP superfamily
MKKLLFIVSLLTVFIIPLVAGSEIKHVILIGADGMGSFILNQHKGNFPHLEKMMNEGASTLEMRSVLPSSSAVNWASHLMGAGPELHGYTDWGSKVPELPSRETGKYGLFPGIFGLMRDHYPAAEAGVIYSWEGIGYLYEQSAVNFNDFKKDNDDDVLKSAINYLSEKKPLLSFIYFSQPDGAGHKMGWGSPEYLEACKKIDAQVGEILNFLKSSGMDKNSIVIFTSDHGGIEKGHGGKTMQEMQVPYILWGKNIKKNYIIPESTMVYDNAATLAYILGLTPPQVWIGRPITSVFSE